MRLRFLLMGLLCWSGSAFGEPAPVLEVADQAMLARYRAHFPRDNRYNDVINRVTLRLLQTSGEPLLPQIQLAVYYSDLGFNAVAFHRIIVLDSLLLDGLKRYAQGAVVHGTVANAYTDRLAGFLGGLQASGQLGQPRQNLDVRNPYAIPAPPGFEASMEAESEALFEELLAAWICHEASHIFLGHVDERFAAAQNLQESPLGKNLPPDQLRRYLDDSIGPDSEYAADAHAVQLLKAAGYSREGLRRVLFLCQRVDEMAGRGSNPLRTHPTPVMRWRHLTENTPDSAVKR